MMSFADFVLYSGGAVGSDFYFDVMAAKYGIIHRKHFFIQGNRTPYGNTVINKDYYKYPHNYDDALKKVNQRLRRKYPTSNSYINDALRRNIAIIDASQNIYAVGTIKNGIVQGGAGWGVHYGILLGRCINVFDQEQKEWLKYNYISMDFEPLEKLACIESFRFAGIGTRDLNDFGKAAIEGLFLVTHSKIMKNELYVSHESICSGI